ncbi:MAG: hypothetical protein R3D68_19550 [Hyphomicrobiaceae bacterium]
MRSAIAALALVGALCGNAAATDLHAFWDQTCKDCHGQHSADFARTFLKVENGKLLGRHHVDDLRTFLGQHHMSEPVAGRIHDMLLAQAATVPVFKAKCAGCHETAADLVRTSVDEVNGVLIGKKRRAPLSSFLQRHGGGLSGADLDAVLKALARLRAETKAP